MTDKEKIRFFTHDDLDAGVSAAVLYRAFLPDTQWFTTPCSPSGPRGINVRVNEFLQDVEDGTAEEESLIITDIAPDQETCKRIDALRDRFVRIRVFDHHSTSLWALGKYPWFIHSTNNACAAKMVWEEYAGSIQSDAGFADLVEATDAWDRWQEGSPHRQRGVNLDSLFNFMGFQGFTKLFSEYPEADSKTDVKFLINQLRSRGQRLIAGAVHSQIRENGPRVYTDKHNNSFVLLLGGGDLNTSTLAHQALDEL